jgi:predicted outer membrane lipoprotein
MLAYILFVSFRLPMRMLAALAFGIIVCFKLELCEMDNNTLKMQAHEQVTWRPNT